MLFKKWKELLMLFIFLIIFVNSVSAAITWDDIGFGGSVTVSEPNVTWSSESFGGSVTVAGWGNWSTWWNITQIVFAAPTSFTVSSVNNSVVNLSWVSNANASATLVVRKKGSSPFDHTDGTVAYNGSSSAFDDSSLDAGTNYYYKSWSYHGDLGLSDDNATGDAWTSPGDPSNLQNTSISNNSINISWVKGTNTTYTVVRYNDTSYPASPQSGTEGYNNTGSYVNLSSLNESTSYYIRVWSYANSLFSDGYISMLTTTYGNNSPPTSFVASGYNTSVINLSWTKGGDADSTHIRSKKGSYPSSVSDGTSLLVYNSSGNSYDDTSLDVGTRYYYRAWSYNITSGFSSSNVSVNATTFPGDPSSLVNSSVTYNSVDFSWTNGTNASRYVIRYSDYAYPSTPQSNASGYNNTLNSCSIGGLVSNSTYYFRLWGYVNPFSEGYLSMSVTTNSTSVDVDPPYSPDSDYDTVNYALNLSWRRGNNSDQDVVVKKTGSYPSSPSDGTIVDINIANLSGSRYYYNESGVTSHAYYRVWSYNTTNATYSSSGLSIPWGALVVWDVYNESNPAQSIGFDIEITNEDASIVYTDSDVTGPLYLDFNDIPYGDNTIFVVTNASYKQRIYYHNLVINTFYNYSFYLPPHYTPVENGSGDDGGDTIETRLYLLSVVGPQNEYTSPPVEDATIEIMRYNDVTDTYVTITKVLTDANGQSEVYLIPYTLYKVTVSKTDYDTTVSEYIPGTDIFTKTFRITPTITVPPEYDIFWDDITLSGTMYLNETIRVIYSDSNTSTVNTTIRLYDVFNGSFTLFDTFNNTNQSFTRWISSINTSHPYELWLWFNNTASYGTVVSPVSITILPVNASWGWSIDLDDRFTNIFGSFTLGYANVFAIILPLIMLMVFGPFNVGAGILACGFSLGFIQVLYATFSIGFNPLLAVLCPICLVFGFMYIRVSGEDHL